MGWLAISGDVFTFIFQCIGTCIYTMGFQGIMQTCLARLRQIFQECTLPIFFFFVKKRTWAELLTKTFRYLGLLCKLTQHVDRRFRDLRIKCQCLCSVKKNDHELSWKSSVHIQEEALLTTGIVLRRLILATVIRIQKVTSVMQDFKECGKVLDWK